MKTIHYSAFVVFLSLILFTACHKRDLTPVSTAPFLKTDKISLTEMSNAVSDTLVISSNIDWKITLPSWVHADTTSGSQGVTTLLINIDANGGTDVRTDNIILAPASSQSTAQPITVKISQGGSAPFIIADRLMLQEDSTGQQDSIVVTSNTSWTLSIPSNAAGWISADKQSGTAGTTKIHFTIAANTNSLLQSADLSITSSNSSLVPLKITIYQAVNYQIQAIAPYGGMAGDTIAVTGVFGPNPNVAVNGITAQVSSSDANHIYFIVPAGASLGKLSISFGTTVIMSQVNFVPYVITSFTNHGQAGDQIVIDGGFGPNPSVKINGLPASNVSLNSAATEITCNVPAGVSTGPIKVYFGSDSLISPSNFMVTNVWFQRSVSSGSMSINQGICFVYNGSVYWGLGKNGASYNNTFYEMDVNYNWVPGLTIASSMAGRAQASVFAVNNYIYMGLGNNAGNNLQDWWQFDPNLTGDFGWTKLTDFPSAVSGAIPFVLNGSGYIAYGNTGSGINSGIYRMDQQGNGSWSWTNITSGSEAANRSVFSIGSIAYFGGGYTNSGNLSDFYSFDPSTSTIATLANLPVTTITNSSETAPSFSYNGKGFIIAHFNQLYQFDPGTGAWTFLGTTPAVTYATVSNNRVFAWDDAGNVYEYIPSY